MGEAAMNSSWTRWNHVEDEPKFHQFWFETVDINFWYSFAESFMFPLIFVAVVLYLVLCLVMMNYMKDKEPLHLRTSLFAWNLIIGIFSVIAMCRIGAEVMAMLNLPQGFYKSVCLREGLHMSTAYWAIAIGFSKPFFMLDTVFLILRKKPVDAVHLIHHTLAIVFAPILIRISEPWMRWVGLANLFVHSIDYPMLALRSLKVSVPKSRQIMAALEIGQMIFVLFLSAYTLFIRAAGSDCMRHPNSVVISYGVYIGLLFVVILTVLSPEYWKRGIKTIKKRASKLD